MRLLLVGTSLVAATAIASLSTLALSGGPDWACILVGLALVFSFWTWIAVVLIALYRAELERRNHHAR